MMSILFAAVAAPIVGLFLGILAWHVAQQRAEMQRGGA